VQIDHDLLHPPAAYEARCHKLKRLVQSPNSFFMDVKCPGCFQMCVWEHGTGAPSCGASVCGWLTLPRSTTVFSHAQTVVFCSSCATVLCQPTGGKARLTEGCSFRKKVE
jgi:small subunit ribosomal protein S27e